MAADYTIRTAISIARAPEDVFDFVTTPANWPKFWPLTIRVEGETVAPLALGGHCIEHVWVGPWRGRFAWTASEVSRPNRFVLTGEAITEDLPREMLALLRDVPCRIEYTITSDAGRGTHFERVMTYPIEGWQGWLGQRMGFGTEISRLIDEALVASKSWLENPLLQAPVAQVSAPELIQQADPLADDAVASLVGPNDDLTELERFLGALYRGDAPAEADAPTPQVARFLRETAALPPWADPSRIRIAEQLFLDWGLLVYASLVCAALPETYVFPSLARVLDGTGGLDLSAVYVRRRLNFTMRMVFDIMNRGGLQARGKGLLAVQRIRVIHAVIRLLVQRKFETSSRLTELSGVARLEGDGLPINQAELLYTLMTFSHVVLRSFERFGCKLTPFEQESYVHTWNVVGALLGIRESLLPHDVEDARRTFDELHAKYAGPTEAGARLAAALGPYWQSHLLLVPHRVGLELMSHVTTQLLEPTTCHWLRLDELPQLPTLADHLLIRLEHIRSHLLSNMFGDFSDTGRAAALLMSMVVNIDTDREEDLTGLGGILTRLSQDRGSAAMS
jgi:uncharacterized protein YndB with AHSA1/START domain